jgi:hypothetical protein
LEVSEKGLRHKNSRPLPGPPPPTPWLKKEKKIIISINQMNFKVSVKALF